MDIIEYYEYAKLAAAAYVNMDAYPAGFTGAQFAIEANKEPAPRVPLAVANQTFDSGSSQAAGQPVWTIPSGGYYGNDSAGFAATLFQRGTEKVLAIRGTEPDFATGQLSLDLLKADLRELGEYGMAISQTVSLFNYVQCLMAPSGKADVMQLQFHSALIPPTPAERSGGYVTALGIPTQFLWVTKTYTGQGLGELIKYGDNLTLTGHSLGGHLAAIGARLFPDLFKEAVTFNAPGYDPALGVSNILGVAFVSLGKQLTDEFINTLFAPNLQEPPAAAFAGHAITVESEDAIPGDDGDGVSGNATGNPFSPENYIITEKVTHDIGHLMDGLGVQALMARMDADLGPAQAGKILEAVTATTGETYELLLEKLHKAIVGTPLALPRTEPSASMVNGGEIAPRREYYEALVSLENRVKSNPVLRLESLLTKSADALTGLATNGDLDALAYRYALKAGNPFAVLGADYSQHNTKHELDLYNPETGTGELTEQWLKDRSAYVTWLSKANTADKLTLDGSKYGYTGSRNWEFIDLTLNQTITVKGQKLGFESTDPANKVIFGSDGNNGSISGGSEDDFLYGMGGNDTLDGKGGADYLEGGSGTDNLTGGEGRDTLLGGAGDDLLTGGAEKDTYRFASNSGTDHVADDGNDSIEWKGISIAGVYRWQEDRKAYLRQGDGSAISLTLDGQSTLTFEDGSKVILDRQNGIDGFKDDPYGIRLEKLPAQAPTTVEVQGDIVPTSFRITVTATMGQGNGWSAEQSSGLSARELAQAGTGTAAYDWFGLVGSILPANTLSYSIVSVDKDANLMTVAYSLFDPLGNIVGEHKEMPEGYTYTDELWGSNDHILALRGNDWVQAGKGDDIVVGGTQDAFPGYQDYLIGEEGNDLLYADQETNLDSLLVFDRNGNGSGSIDSWRLAA